MPGELEEHLLIGITWFANPCILVLRLFCFSGRSVYLVSLIRFQKEMAEDYFAVHHQKKIVTSDRTLSKLQNPRMTQKVYLKFYFEICQHYFTVVLWHMRVPLLLQAENSICASNLLT